MDKKTLEKTIIDVLKTCYDPEIPVDVYELGLIYEIKISEKIAEENEQHTTLFQPASEIPYEVKILMTLTSPNCPVAETLPVDVENKIKNIHGVSTAKVDITFEPPWDKEMMSEEAKLELGFL